MDTQTTDTNHSIVCLRRTLLLLSRNQDTAQQRAAAGRHLAALHAAMMGVRRDDGRHTDTEGERRGHSMMTEQQLDDLARMAAQHIHEQHVADPEGDDAVWEARLGRAIALAIRDALAAHEHRFLHLRGND